MMMMMMMIRENCFASFYRWFLVLNLFRIVFQGIVWRRRWAAARPDCGGSFLYVEGDRVGAPFWHSGRLEVISKSFSRSCLPIQSPCVAESQIGFDIFPQSNTLFWQNFESFLWLLVYLKKCCAGWTFRPPPRLTWLDTLWHTRNNWDLLLSCSQDAVCGFPRCQCFYR